MKKLLLIFVFIILIILFYFSENLKEIAAGTAILLFGMFFLEDGFKLLSGGPVEKWLRNSTDSVLKSISFGLVSSTILQSSALVAVITISFLSTGLIGLSSGIGITLGANIGTTTGAWLISFFGLKLKISSFALPLLVFGIILVLQSNRKLKALGNVFAGIGFLFLGIHFTKEGFANYQSSIDLLQFGVPGIWGIIVYTFIGIIVTVVMQSSHASLAIILAALSTNQISYENAIGMTIGANIGSTLTPVLGSLNSNAQGKRLATAHVFFKVITSILILIFITQFIWIVDKVSFYMGLGAKDLIFKLSLFHTLFNLFGVILFIPFVPFLVKVLTKIIKQPVSEDIAQPIYLSKTSLKYPETAIPALIKESRHLFDNAFEIIAHGLNLHRQDILSDKKLKELVPRSTENMQINIDEIYLKKVKLIYSKIVKYATLIQSSNLSEENSVVINKVRVANRYIIEIIKHLRNSQTNISFYSVSDNDNIKNEYNLLRLKIAKVMREIYRTEKVEDLNEQHNKLKRLQKKAKYHDVLINGKLDELIRDKKINSKMATSLMNDSALVARICEKLITIAELLYIESDSILENDELYSEEEISEFFEENAV